MGRRGIYAYTKQRYRKKIQLLRNHGLINRDRCEVFGFNSRLDTLQAAVANYKLKNKLNKITNMRIKNAKLFDKLLKKIQNNNNKKRKLFKRSFPFISNKFERKR